MTLFVTINYGKYHNCGTYQYHLNIFYYDLVLVQPIHYYTMKSW